jgi:hypothetical protein
VNPCKPYFKAKSIFLVKSSKVACFTGKTKLKKQHSAMGNTMLPSLSNVTFNISDRGGNIFVAVQKQHRSGNPAPSTKEKNVSIDEYFY